MTFLFDASPDNILLTPLFRLREKSSESLRNVGTDDEAKYSFYRTVNKYSAKSSPVRRKFHDGCFLSDIT